MRTINLHKVTMRVSSTADVGVVNAETRVHFSQKGSRVFARYAGGSVVRGCLVGSIYGAKLIFRYVQLESSGQIHGGRSTCKVSRSAKAGLRLTEHFTWSTRSGRGTNIFDEVL